MKYLYPILLLFVFITCKKKQDPEPDPFVPPGEVKQELPMGVLAFAIDEVPKENIRFVALDANMPNPNRIMVTLPQNYTKGDQITARIKLPEGYIIRDFFLNEYDPNALTSNFAKTDYLWLFIYDKKKDANLADLYVYIEPTIPLVAPSVGKNYEEVLKGGNVFVFLPVQNLGTAETITEKNIWLHYVDILIRNKKTGETATSKGGYFLGNPNNDLFAEIPAELTAGEYELTVRKQNRQVVIPDALILKYGAPVVNILPVTTVSRENPGSITYQGYNLLPEHEYVMELKNDFTPTLRIKLTPDSHLSITHAFQASIPDGNYEATLFIDGKAQTPYLGFNRNLFVVKKENSQPEVTLLSNENNAVGGEATLYKAITTFKRKDTIIANFRDGVRANMVLLFKNTLTGKEYELPYSGITPAVLGFPLFDIPEQVPAGKYEVRVRESNKISERYQRIITIE